MTIPSDPRSAPLDELANVDITSAGFKADPFTFYARLRADAPVFAVGLRLGRKVQRAWLVTRYDDVSSLLKNDAEFVKNPRNVKSRRRVPGPPKTHATP